MTVMSVWRRRGSVFDFTAKVLRVGCGDRSGGPARCSVCGCVDRDGRKVLVGYDFGACRYVTGTSRAGGSLGKIDDGAVHVWASVLCGRCSACGGRLAGGFPL